MSPQVWPPVPGQGQMPSSVQVGGGSYSILGDGTVAFTSVPWISLNDVFTGFGADIYRAILRARTSASMQIGTRMRAAGSDVTTGYTRAGTNTRLSNGPDRASQTSATQFGNWLPTTAGTGSFIVGEMTLYAPAISGEQTVMQMHAYSSPDSDRYDWHESGDVAGVHTGITFFRLGGTGVMTGFVKVDRLA